MAKLDLKGLQNMMRRAGRVQKKMEKDTLQGLFFAANRVMTLSKTTYVPVDQGILRSTGRVGKPKKTRREFMVELFYGGPAATYALIQHERPDFSHTVGQWKYLETPLLREASQSGNIIAAEVRL